MRMPLYLRATAAGVLGGVIVGVVSTWVFLQLQLWWQMRQTDGGGLGAASVSLGWTLLAAVIGFLVVFFWVLRRS
jgi:small-conductance mechanosensitive channel